MGGEGARLLSIPVVENLRDVDDVFVQCLLLAGDYHDKER